MRRLTRERLIQPGELILTEELYARLERNTVTLNGPVFGDDFQTQSQNTQSLADPCLSLKLSLEASCQRIWLSENFLKHSFTWQNPVAAEDYLRMRKTETQNVLLRVRYGLLWLLSLPKGSHTGEVAKELVTGIRSWLEHDQGQHEATEETYIELVQLGLMLSKIYRHEPNVMRQTVLDNVLKMHQSVVLKWWQIQFFGRHAKLFRRDECEMLEVVSQQVYDYYNAEGSAIIKYVCESAGQLAVRATSNARKWQDLKGDFLKSQAQQRYVKDSTDFVVQILFTDALHCYKAAGNKQQVREVEELLSATKHQVQLQKAELNVSLDGPEGKLISSWMRKMPEWILAGEGLLVFWRMRYNLLPSQPRIDTATTKLGLADIFRHTAFDRNRNITTRQKEIFSSYGLIMAFYKRMTFEVFEQGLMSGQITYATTLEFLREQTWLGQMEFQRAHDEDSSSTYTLISWVEPSLRSYFAEKERTQSDVGYKPDLMLCLDSLTLKMEAILRHFCRAVDPPITTNRSGLNGDQIEMPLEEIIKSVEKYSGVDAGYWLRFVFTKEGWNLRNNVAHGFMNPQDYSLEAMQTVILALFVLATLNIMPREIAADESLLSDVTL